MNQTYKKNFAYRFIKETAFFLSILAVLFLGKIYDYVLFHSLAEFISAFVFISIFILIWNLRKYFEEGFFTVLAISSLFVGIIDILHLFSYKGIILSDGFGENLSAQLWIAGRYLFSSSLIFASFFSIKKINFNPVFASYAAVFTLLMISIFYFKNFPLMYEEKSGLPVSKNISEYAVSGLFLISAVILYTVRKRFNRNLVILLISAFLLSIPSELSLTIPADSFSNLDFAGHIFKIISVYLIYRAVIQKGLRYPFDMMFKNIIQKETEVRYEKDKLRMYLDNSAEIVIIINTSQKIEMINRKGCELLGYSADELLGLDWYDDILPEEIRDEMKKEFSQIISGNPKNGYHESYVVTHDKRRLTIAWHYSAIKDEDGNITGILGSGNDITEKKGIDDRIIHLASFPEMSINPISEIDMEGNIRYLNPSIKRYFPDIEDKGIDHPWFTSFDYNIDINTEINERSFIREIKIGGLFFEQNIVFTDIYKRIRIYGHDITKRKIIENELKRNTERFRLVLENSPIAVSCQDLDLRYTWLYNSRMGYPQEDAVGKRDADILPASAVEVLVPFKKNAMLTKREARRDIKVDSGSSVYYYDIIVSPMLDINGNCEGIITITIDITKNRLMEESSVLSKFCIDKAADGFIWLTPDAKILYANEKACSMYGYTQDEMKSMTIHELAPSFSYDRWPERWESIKQHGSYILEGKHVSKFGNVFPVEITVNYIKYEDNEFNCSIIRDITERKKMEELIHKSHIDLEEKVMIRTRELENKNLSLNEKINELGKMTKTLTRQSSLLEAFFGHTMTSLAFLDRDLNFIRINNAFSTAFKKVNVKFEGKNYYDLFPSGVLRKMINDVLNTGEISRENSVAFGETSNPNFFDVSIVPILNTANEVDFLVFVLNEVTERINAENQLKASEEMFRTVLENLPVGVWIVDRDGKIIHGNTAGKKIWQGYSLIPVDQYGVNKGWRLDTGSPIKPEEWAVTRAVKKGEISINEEIEIECYDGSRKIISNSALPLKNSDNMITGAIILNEDITERKARENSIITTNSLLRFAAKSSSKKEYLSSVLSLLSQVGKLNYAGVRLIDEKGTAPFAVHHGFEREFIEFENAISIENNQCICTRLINGVPDEYETSFITDGGSFYCNNSLKFLSEISSSYKAKFSGKCLESDFNSILLVPVKYGDIKVGLLHFADKRENAIKNDFVELVELQVNFIAEGIFKFDQAEKIISAEKELLLARRLSDIGALAATVAHELRNPLAAIRMAAYNIKNKAKNPDLEKHILNIDKKVSEGDQIIKNLLFYTRIKTADCQNTDLYELLDETVDSIGSRYLSKDVSIIKKFDSLKGLVAFIDPLLIKELFENIINNSYDAVVNKKGIIEINSCISRKYYEISIIDNGCGIDPEDMPRIFEPFFSTKSKGTGLGLSVCRQIINLHHGDIGIESNKDKGTTINIKLPLGEV